MFTLFFSAIFSIRSWLRSRAALQVEILALRHPANGPEEIAARPASSELRGPTALGWALPPLVAVALGAADCKARNGDLLASKRVPLVLAMEESAGRTKKACDPWGGSGFDSQDEFGKSALGSAGDPWREPLLRRLSGL